MNGWVNKREAGDSRRHCAHYDVTVIVIIHTVNVKINIIMWQLLNDLVLLNITDTIHMGE